MYKDFKLNIIGIMCLPPIEKDQKFVLKNARNFRNLKLEDIHGYVK